MKFILQDQEIKLTNQLLGGFNLFLVSNEDDNLSYMLTFPGLEDVTVEFLNLPDWLSYNDVTKELIRLLKSHHRGFSELGKFCAISAKSLSSRSCVCGNSTHTDAKPSSRGSELGRAGQHMLRQGWPRRHGIQECWCYRCVCLLRGSPCRRQ